MLRGWDFGFVSPVCLFGQLTFFGQLRIRRELCPFNTPLDQLVGGVRAITMELGGGDAILDRTLAVDIGGRDEEAPETFDAGDPAGTNITDLGSSAEVLGNHGIVLHTTRPGTELSYAGLRSRFLQYVVEPQVGPVPAIIIHPDCRNLRAALSGAFSLSSTPPYRPVKTHPEKDLVDALRYLEDNIRARLQPKGDGLVKLARQDERALRAPIEPSGDDTYAAQLAKEWRQTVERM
jgi:hypothetical protein